MIINCLKCGTHNRIPDSDNLQLRVICGSCKSPINLDALSNELVRLCLNISQDIVDGSQRYSGDDLDSKRLKNSLDRILKELLTHGENRVSFSEFLTGKAFNHQLFMETIIYVMFTMDYMFQLIGWRNKAYLTIRTRFQLRLYEKLATDLKMKNPKVKEFEDLMAKRHAEYATIPEHNPASFLKYISPHVPGIALFISGIAAVYTEEVTTQSLQGYIKDIGRVG